VLKIEREREKILDRKCKCGESRKIMLFLNAPYLFNQKNSSQLCCGELHLYCVAGLRDG
jgi:hypothetical protein